jgi:hypothetical protein
MGALSVLEFHAGLMEHEDAHATIREVQPMVPMNDGGIWWRWIWASVLKPSRGKGQHWAGSARKQGSVPGVCAEGAEKAHDIEEPEGGGGWDKEKAGQALGYF